MTSPVSIVPFPYRICRNGLHQVPRDVKMCPECAEVSYKRNYLKNKEQQIARAREKYFANHEESKRIEREAHRRFKEKHPDYYKQQYRKNREKRLADSLAYNKAHRELGVWKSMISRCTSRLNKSYPNYGGRGIEVCDRWVGERGYHNFLEDMGKRPSDRHSLDRTDNDGNYDPDNCAWRTWKEQCQNRRNNFNITFNGVNKCLSEWGRETGLSYWVIRARIVDLGWTVERALTEPARKIEYPNSDLLFCVCRNPNCKTPYGTCHCGCNGKTAIAKQSLAARGHVKGMPILCLPGHTTRHATNDLHTLRSIIAVEK